MFKFSRTYIKPNTKLIFLINENPYLLLFLQHFNIDLTVADKDFSDLEKEYKIPVNILIIIANLYNGFLPVNKDLVNIKGNVKYIIEFLKNSHKYYKYDKYPEIKDLIKNFLERFCDPQLELISNFFNEYFNEVLEHLSYEDDVVFPYMESLITNNDMQQKKNFSINEYKEHHTDIETKLTDLKILLLKHLKVGGIDYIKRRLLISLFELEYDIHMHALIEETILIPLLREMESLYVK